MTLTLPHEVVLGALVAWDLSLTEREYRNRQALEACATDEQRVAFGHRQQETALGIERARRDIYAEAYTTAPIS